MREILFRAYVKDKEKIYNIKQIDFDYGMVWFEEENKPTDTMRMFDQIELMQFTGLTDKNGKKIFEGDIVKFTTFPFDFSKIGFVCFLKGSFFIQHTKKGYDSFHQFGRDYRWQDMGASGDLSFEYEVIGNIHDNKELLGE